MKLIKIFITLVISLMAVHTQAQSRAEYMAVLDVLDVADMRNTFIRSGEHGFYLKSYWTDDMERSFQKGYLNQRVLKDRAKQSFLQLLQNMNSGLVDPQLMGSDVRMRKVLFLTPKQLRVVLLAQGNRATSLLESFSPQTPQYLGLKEALRRMTYYCDQNLWQVLPNLTQPLRLGTIDKTIPSIKNRLRQFGYNITTIDDIFDAQTLNAVIDIQSNLHFKPDGVISPGGSTFQYLSVPCRDRIQQVRVDMDKMRWFPKTFGDRYIFVNLAMTHLSLADRNMGLSQIHKTINGRPTRRSPTMMDKIVELVVNPYWIVPPTIFREDKLMDLKGLTPDQVSVYFDSHNYELWNKNFTKRLNPALVNWSEMDSTRDYDMYIRQKPSLNNALGALKFMLTNSFAIYLHDTNQPELFSEPYRLLSSGCVRVEHPVDVAEYLMLGTKWDRSAIEKLMAKPGEVMDQDTTLQVSQPLPVYMAFLTSQLSSDGVLRFAEDTYGQRERMLELGAW